MWRGLPAIPLLVPIVNLTALANGALPLHASAFVHRGTGVVATGWSKGGKTEALLAFSANGARYVGDEWVYVAADGSRVSGIPSPFGYGTGICTTSRPSGVGSARGSGRGWRPSERCTPWGSG